MVRSSSAEFDVSRVQDTLKNSPRLYRRAFLQINFFAYFVLLFMNNFF